MSLVGAHQETSERRQQMLRSACSGAVRDALAASDVIEILANPDGSIWIERAGRGVARENEVLDVAARERIIRLVADSIGENCNRSSPIVSAELPGNGERFEGLLPPVSEAPCFAIRKPARAPFTVDDYISQGALAPALAAALVGALREKRNILIAGGTSSGKTTFVNALLAEEAIADERVVILEDTRELKCAAANCIALRTHRDGARLTDLVKSTMRLRPDRIIVGEVRGAEALDLLKAWNTGHPGGVTTCHANSALSALHRLEQLTLEATSAPASALIADAIDVVVFMGRANGVRRIEEACTVSGFENGAYKIEPLARPHLTQLTEGEFRES